MLRLGNLPLANALRDETGLALPEPRYPLDLAVCRSCSLAQITQTIPADKLFGEYAYFSSFSDTVVDNARSIAARMIRGRQLGPTNLVVEAASNDGYLLQHYRAAGVQVLGIDPARNVVDAAKREKDVPTVCAFFGDRVGRQMAAEGQMADVFHANNVLAHVPDLNGFVEGIRCVLKPAGIAIIEVPYVKELIERCEFDTIYHEHLCYFSLISVQSLFHSHDLVVHDVERLAIHGGSLRLFVSHREHRQPTAAVIRLLSEERTCGVDSLSFYADFAARVETLRGELKALLGTLTRDGERMAAYGASAKGSTLLSYCDVGRDILDFVVDRSPHKHGRYMPGTGLPIYPPKMLLDRMPKYLLLLAWNVADEIALQQAEYVNRGGRFIVPVPHPLVVGE